MSVEISSVLDAQQWEAYGLVYAFIGNELLTPMNRSQRLTGLDPGFWQKMPEPQNDAGREALERLEAYARQAQKGSDGDDPHTPGMLGASVEYTKLFIGPPAPAATPWETTNDLRNEDKVGFGRSTIAMKQLLADEGLQLAGGENNQYEDHMGVELLYLSELCRQAAAACADGDEAVESVAKKAAWFIVAHPLEWIDRFRANVDAAYPDGYYSPLLQYTQAVLQDNLDSLVA